MKVYVVIVEGAASGVMILGVKSNSEDAREMMMLHNSQDNAGWYTNGLARYEEHDLVTEKVMELG